MSTEETSPSPSRTQSRARGIADDATWPVRRAAMAVEKHVVWAGGDAARSVARGISWPFEQALWVLRRRVLWPAQDWFRARGVPARVAVAALPVLALLGIAIALGIGSSGSGQSSAPLAAAPPPAPVTPVPAHILSSTPAAPKPTGPVLHGTAPTFAVPGTDSVTSAPTDTGSGADATSTGSTGATGATGTTGATGATGADSPVALHVPGAGSDPIVVARRFSSAFVLYEVGRGDAQVRKTFRETATPTLAAALRKRPPRQPAQVKVPKARVLNIVPGPREAGAQPVSVSLLRLGATSELRLMLNRTKGGWIVTDVRG